MNTHFGRTLLLIAAATNIAAAGAAIVHRGVPSDSAMHVAAVTTDAARELGTMTDPKDTHAASMQATGVPEMPKVPSQAVPIQQASAQREIAVADPSQTPSEPVRPRARAPEASQIAHQPAQPQQAKPEPEPAKPEPQQAQASEQTPKPAGQNRPPVLPEREWNFTITMSDTVVINDDRLIRDAWDPDGDWFGMRAVSYNGTWANVRYSYCNGHFEYTPKDPGTFVFEFGVYDAQKADSIQVNRLVITTTE